MGNDHPEFETIIKGLALEDLEKCQASLNEEKTRKTQILKCEEKLTKLNSQILENNGKVENLKSEVATAETALTDANSQIAEKLKESFQEWHGPTQDDLSEIEDLRATRNKLEIQIAKSSTEMKGQINNIVRLLKKRDSFQSELESLTAENLSDDNGYESA